MSEARIQVLPLPEVHGIWEHDFSRYPDVIRVPMSDGKVIDYRLQDAQPAPVLAGLLDAFDAACVGGYKYKEKSRKRTGKKEKGEENNESTL